MCGLLVTTDGATDFSAFKEGLETLKDRGPDDQRIEAVDGGIMGFQRLAIMGCDEKGMQPFHRKGNAVVCNGELYGSVKSKRNWKKKDIHLLQILTVNFCCRYMKNTAPVCLLI